jgi:dTDP-4-dehydrorhamnose reductase
VNHYLASERLLDHRIELHPDRAIADRELGECGGVPYVDVDAIRNLRSGVLGLPALLRQACERYGRTVAVTECHNGASREEQTRWFVEVWNGVEALRAEGYDIPAVTAWSLLGSHDWNRMVTRFIGHYEVGVYDVRTGEARPTMLAPVLRDLAEGRKPKAIALQQPGWWRRESRFLDARSVRRPEYDLARVAPEAGADDRLLIVGSDSPLVKLLVGACEARGLYYRRMAAADERTIGSFQPWAVIDARDWAGVCEEGAAGFAPPEALVTACDAADVPCAVFTAHGQFPEVDARLLALGGQKLLLAATERVFAPWHRSRFAVRTLDALDFELPVPVNPDEPWNGVYGPDLIDAVLDALMDGVAGRVSLVFDEDWSVAEFARRLADVRRGRPGPGGRAAPAHGAPGRSKPSSPCCRGRDHPRALRPRKPRRPPRRRSRRRPRHDEPRLEAAE